jgi:membrane protein DedA with SNARE-associated domain
MLTNGIGNFPSSQILYIICGYFVSTGSLLFIPTILAGAIGNTIGNSITFLLVKKYERPFAQKLLMMNDELFTKVHTALHKTFSKNGLWYIFVGKLIPSIKAFIPIVAGLAKTKTSTTFFIFFSASLIWAIMITSLGYFFGEHVSLKEISVVSLCIGLLVLFLVYRTFIQKIQK